MDFSARAGGIPRETGAPAYACDHEDLGTPHAVRTSEWTSRPAQPRANAICERLVSSMHRECLDHILIVSEAHLRRVLSEYVTYFNRPRPHQGINQRVPDRQSIPDSSAATAEEIVSFPVLGGLHHEYRRVA